MRARVRTGHYHTLAGSRLLLLCIAILAGLAVTGYLAARAMALSDHGLTGLTSHIPWGLSHVVAIFLILGAPGALHIATLGSVMGRPSWQPWSRLSGAVGIAMLVPGLCLLVLDLGRPGHITSALPGLNFTSVFSWNLLLYIGLILIAIGYIAILMNRRWAPAIPWAGMLALVWRILLTTATASIFAVLPGRAVFPTATLVVLFIALSWLIGTAVLVVAMSAVHRLEQRSHKQQEREPGQIDAELLCRLLRILILPVLGLVVTLYGTFLLTGAYQGFAAHIVTGANIYTLLWWVFIVVGGVIPLWYGSRMGLPAMAGCILLGCLSLVYVLVISSQGWQVDLFAGREVVAGSLVTGMATYVPQWTELAFALGALALAALLILLWARVLPLLPDPADSGLL